MGRPLRINVPNIPFHVLSRGNNKQVVFCEPAEFDYYLKLIKKYKEEFKFKLYHFCLMPNHLHFQIEPTIEGSLSKFMQKITLAHTKFFHQKYGTVGHIWQGRYKSSLIDRDEYFLHCGFYIEQNPRRKGLVEKAEDWKWSSYKFYAFGEKDSLIAAIIDPDPFYLELSLNPEKRQKFYREMAERVMEDYFLKRIRSSLDHGVFGREEFFREMKDRFKDSFLRGRGRPPKNRENRV